MDLVELVTQYGTDKMANGYVPIYHALLDGRRESVRSLLEVGIGTMIPNVHSSMVGVGRPGYRPGGSLRLWRDYLPNASIIGMDVQLDTQFTEERIETVLCDSRNTDEVQRALALRTFDVVIDDGSHESGSQWATLQNLYRRVTHGGLYIIEDIYSGSPVATEPRAIRSIVGHNEFFFAGTTSNLCVIFAHPLTWYDRTGF
jgi:hypothetical protein